MKNHDASITPEMRINLIDSMGGDALIARAARMSYNSESDNGGPKDKALIFTLMEKGHLSPFENFVMCFEVECPIFVARQWMRHRIGSFNEKSGRYTEINKFYIPAPGLSAKQEKVYRDVIDKAYASYQELLNDNVKREVARMVLPVSSMTKFMWTVNFRSFMNFLNQRLDSHAQEQIRILANGALALARNRAPICVEAYETKNKDHKH